MYRILIIDDDFAVQASLELLLKQNNFAVLSAGNPQKAAALIGEYKFDLILLDMNFSLQTSGQEGLQVLADLKQKLPLIPVILITAWGTIDLAVQGMKGGAADFITKPWNNQHLLRSIQTALQLSQGEKTAGIPTRQELDKHYDLSAIIGNDPAFLAVLDTVGRVSTTDAAVLIQGESGSGKELIAEAIHQNSPRRHQPFIKINLGGIPVSLFESEMFGHRRGAFTDAHFDRTGRFDMANKGTIFLDEIGELDQNSQVKLLRVLQDGSFEILGSSQTRNTDVRVISATNRSLEEMIGSGQFREDLFYRVNLITITLPALRERKSDIPLLTEYFLSRLRKTYKRPRLQVGRSALNWLENHSWPGNIRELKNLIERVVLVSTRDKLEIDDFIGNYQTQPRRTSKHNLPEVGAMSLDEMEKTMIEKTMQHYNRNLSQVARSLGLSRAALYRRIQKFGIKI